MWALPTRSRPENCLRFIKAWHNSQASTPVYVRLDNDDPQLDQLSNLPWPGTFVVHTGPRQGISRAMNEVFIKHPNEDWYGFLADDLLPQTPYWDLKLIERAGKYNISYPNDQGKDTTLPTHPCIGGDLVRAIGWLGLPVTQHYFIDTVWRFLGEQLGNIHRLDDVIVEHLHYSLNKSDMDQVYIESSEKWKHDKRAYRDWCETQGKLLIARLQHDIY